MKKKIIYLSIFLMAVILQTSVFGVLAHGNYAIDGVLMLILAWSIIDGFFPFLGWALSFGIFYDLLTYNRVGINVLIFLATIYFVSFFSRRFSVDLKGIGLIFFLLFVVIVSIFSHAVFAFMAAIEMGNFNSFWGSIGSVKAVLLQLFFNVALFFFWFTTIRKSKEYFAL